VRSEERHDLFLDAHTSTRCQPMNAKSQTHDTDAQTPGDGGDRDDRDALPATRGAARFLEGLDPETPVSELYDEYRDWRERQEGER